MTTTTFTLPFGIVVTRTQEGVAEITSNLEHEVLTPDLGPSARIAALGFVDGLESLLVGLASEGLDLSAPAFARAVEASIEGFCNNV
jgi:hypothetical protein